MHVRLNTILLAVAVLCFATATNAQVTPNWLWSRGSDSLQTSASVVSVATDDDGFAAICGIYNENISIGGTFLQIDPGYRNNFYVALYDKNGTMIWARKIGSVIESHGAVTKTMIDSQRNVYVFGYYQDSASFNDVSYQTPNYTSIFVAAYDKDGNRLWVNTLAKNVKPYDNTHQSTYKFASGEINGRLYIAGSFDDSLIIPSTLISKPFTFAKSGTDNFFLASFDHSGQLGSIASFEGTGTITALCGHSTGATTSDAFIGASLNGGSKLLIAEVKNNGQIIWADTASTGYGLIGDIAYNAAKNALFVAGSFGTALTFNLTTLTAHSSFFDGFVLKLSGAGAFKWLQQIGGDRVDQCLGVGFDYDDNTYATGYFQQSATFGATTLSNPSDARANTLFIAKYDLDGKAVWALRPFSDNAYSQGNAIAVKTLLNNSIFANITGSYSSQLQFGNTTPLYGSGFFLARLLLNGSAQVKVLISKDITLKVFPNPSNTNTTIDFVTDEVSVVEITMTDVLGRLVKANKFDLGAGKQSIELSISDLSAGIYFCNVTVSGKQIGSSKLIIE